MPHQDVTRMVSVNATSLAHTHHIKGTKFESMC